MKPKLTTDEVQEIDDLLSEALNGSRTAHDASAQRFLAQVAKADRAGRDWPDKLRELALWEWARDRQPTDSRLAMSLGMRFPALPDDWANRCVAVHDATGCWLWTDPRLPWDTARVLIGNAINHTRMDLCGITPRCVKPTHGAGTSRPIAGGAA